MRSRSDALVCVYAEARRILKRVREEASAAIEGLQSQAAASSSDDAARIASDAKRTARRATATNDSLINNSNVENFCDFIDCDSSQFDSCNESSGDHLDLTDDEMQAAGERGRGVGHEEGPPPHPLAPQRPSYPHPAP